VLTGGWGKIGAVTVAVIAEGNGWSLNGDGCLGGGIDLDERRLLVHHQTLVESPQTVVLIQKPGIDLFKLFHFGFHFVHLDTFLVSGVLGSNSVLELPPHQFLLWCQVVQVGPLSSGLLI